MARLALLALLSLALLGTVPPASADVVPSPPLPAALPGEEAEEPDESGAVEEAIRECEEDPVACEEEEEAEAADRGAGECPLRSARARAVARRGRLKVTVGYSTDEPVKATIEIYNGAGRIGSFKRRLGRSGVLRFTEPLSQKQGVKRIVVRIQLSTGSAGCPSRRLVLFAR